MAKNHLMTYTTVLDLLDSGGYVLGLGPIDLVQPTGADGRVMAPVKLSVQVENISDPALQPRGNVEHYQLLGGNDSAVALQRGSIVAEGGGIPVGYSDEVTTETMYEYVWLWITNGLRQLSPGYPTPNGMADGVPTARVRVTIKYYYLSPGG